MKKIGIFICLVSLMTTLSFENVRAEEEQQLPDGDMTITQNVIDVGENYADMMEAQSRLTRTDEEVWNVVGDPVILVGYDTIKGTRPVLVGTGETKSNTFSWTIGADVTIKGYPISVTVSGSKTIKKSGPSDGYRLTNGYEATHRAFFALAKGKVAQYTYRVTSKYTGAFLREETRILIADASTIECSQYISSVGTTFYVQNSQGTNTRAVSETSYYNRFLNTGESADDYYYF